MKKPFNSILLGFEKFKMIIDHGFDLNVKDQNGKEIVHYGSFMQMTRLVKFTSYFHF
jgi:hypothetical protein